MTTFLLVALFVGLILAVTIVRGRAGRGVLVALALAVLVLAPEFLLHGLSFGQWLLTLGTVQAALMLAIVAFGIWVMIRGLGPRGGSQR